MIKSGGEVRRGVSMAFSHGDVSWSGLPDSQIPSNVRYVCHNIDAQVTKMVSGAYTGEHEKLNIKGQPQVSQNDVTPV